MAAVARRATWSGLLASTRASTRRENILVDRLGREPATCPTDYPELGRFGKLSFGRSLGCSAEHPGPLLLSRQSGSGSAFAGTPSLTIGARSCRRRDPSAGKVGPPTGL